jgi:hypothetical protein
MKKNLKSRRNRSEEKSTSMFRQEAGTRSLFY